MVKLENRQIVHLVSEIIVIGTVIYWFQKKTADLSLQLSNMSKKLEEQSAIINRHEQMIGQLVGLVDTLSRDVPVPLTNPQPVIQQHQPKQLTPQPQPVKKNKVSFIQEEPKVKVKSKPTPQPEPEPEPEPELGNEDDELSETESEIDREIQDEIEELGLKKQPL